VNELLNETIVIPHIDDVACSHGANVAMVELGLAGGVTCGSAMVPPGWFPDIAAHPRLGELDLGIHLTLTSESSVFRWRPISATSRASGLIDSDGYMWSRVSSLRANAVPEAVEGELRAQIDTALAAGIDVTHLDHHMGAALSPEYVHATVRIARDYRIPIFFPSAIDTFVSVVEMGELDFEELEDARREAGDLAVGDTFVMGLTYQTESDARRTFERLLRGVPPGVTYLSLHCSSRGDIEQIHPNDAGWRIAEYELFSDPDFVAWLSGQSFRTSGMRQYRDALAS
jgi:predicted glycoside hydrolase/deacetylase ChbG (UPF0249 family)